ncbi:murein L,D-transpeptidase catalytic domain family protein [Photobacterium leiognathi]|uniref:murein L,D-transpeptidase catalytic domain family protein n=1 Tax=Photobacterium leiognathi TaxID=553611 RepID=UPI002736CCF0|nr:murein L,D-transpeptidase catalytic domain family protein [Photobacterium leiognathi]
MKVWVTSLIIMLLSVSHASYAAHTINQQAKIIYDKTKLGKHLKYDVFLTAYKEHIRVADKPIMSIIDYSKPSDRRRFFIINTEEKKLLHHTFVSHGINSGDLYATEFSNIVDSKQTSLGTFRVAEAYHGKYGISLRLDGMSPSNSNARKRAIVLHGAKYAEPSTIKKLGMLGRSWGCPAIPMQLAAKVVHLLKEGGSIYAHARG